MSRYKLFAASCGVVGCTLHLYPMTDTEFNDSWMLLNTSQLMVALVFIDTLG